MSENKRFFEGKVIIITGAASGIGEVIAKEFFKFNCKLSLVDSDEQNLSRVGQSLRSLEPNNYQPLELKADLSDSTQITSIIGLTIAIFGRIDMLINNAGIDVPIKSEDPSAMEIYDNIMSVNLRAIYQLCNLSFKHLLKSRGNIINISSIDTIRTNSSFNTAFCISKSGLNTLTKCLANEWGKYGIRVNCVNPGHTETTNLDESIPKHLLDKLYPLGRYGRPKDIANCIVFLASESASFLTGVNLPIDGGYGTVDALTGSYIAKEQLLFTNN